MSSELNRRCNKNSNNCIFSPLSLSLTLSFSLKGKKWCSEFNWAQVYSAFFFLKIVKIAIRIFFIIQKKSVILYYSQERLIVDRLHFKSSFTDQALFYVVNNIKIHLYQCDSFYAFDFHLGKPKIHYVVHKSESIFTRNDFDYFVLQSFFISTGWQLDYFAWRSLLSKFLSFNLDNLFILLFLRTKQQNIVPIQTSLNAILTNSSSDVKILKENS